MPSCNATVCESRTLPTFGRPTMPVLSAMHIVEDLRSILRVSKVKDLRPISTLASVRRHAPEATAACDRRWHASATQLPAGKHMTRATAQAERKRDCLSAVCPAAARAQVVTPAGCRTVACFADQRPTRGKEYMQSSVWLQFSLLKRTPCRSARSPFASDGQDQADKLAVRQTGQVEATVTWSQCTCCALL